MSDEHLTLVTYDIADERRWRAVFRLMNGYGQWVQLSVFQCRLTSKRRAELVAVERARLERSSFFPSSNIRSTAEYAPESPPVT